MKIEQLPSGSWRVRVPVINKYGEREYKSITRETRKEILQVASDYERNKLNATDKTVREAVSDYIDLSRETLSPTTLKSYDRILRFAFPALMKMSILDIDSTIVQREINKEIRRTNERTGKPLSAKTVKNEYGLISAALKQEGLSFNIRLPKIQHKNLVLPEPSDVVNIIKGTPVELPCLLALWCGLRMSEIRGLSYDSIHGDELWIDKVIVDVGKESILKHYAKNDSSIRKVYLPPYIKELINNTAYEPKYVENGKYRLIIPLTHNQIAKPFVKMMDDAGMHISFHKLRHMFCSIQLTTLAIPSQVVQQAGGWKTDHTMKTVYSNSFNSAQKEANEKMEKYCLDLLVENSASAIFLPRKIENLEISMDTSVAPWVRVPCPAPKKKKTDP